MSSVGWNTTIKASSASASGSGQQQQQQQHPGGATDQTEPTINQRPSVNVRSSTLPLLGSGLASHPIPIAQHFNSPFTPREEELQRLLAQERARSEQRKSNYAILKEEHLRLQNEFLSVQAEMKQILEETMYFKEKKNNELEELLSTIEDKTRQVDRLEKQMRENEPEVMRLKITAELEEPMKRLAKENDRLTKERDKALHEIAMVRQQLDHAEREHLDSIDRIRLSYEAEMNVVKREKEEIRARLVEASQVPDVKRLVEMSEENARLTRKLQSAQSALEQAEAQYRSIQARVEQFVVEQDQKDKLHENEIKQLQDQVQGHRQDSKLLRSKLELKQSEVDDLSEEISRLKRVEERIRFESEQHRTRFEQEKDEVRRSAETDRCRMAKESQTLKEQIKKLKSEIDTKEEMIQSMQLELNAKNQEAKDKATATRKQEMDKVLVLEQKRKALELTLKDSLHERQMLKSDLDKLRKQLDAQNESKLSLERELMIIRAKSESQAETIEDLEKIRRQHLALHDEVCRLRSESYDIAAANKELTRVGANTKEELTRLKQALEEQRRTAEEARISNEKLVSKLTRRFEDERTELRDKVMALERENTKLRVSATSGAEVRQGLNEYNRLRAKQYSKIADRLGTLLEQLKVDNIFAVNENHEQPKQTVVENHNDSVKPTKTSKPVMMNRQVKTATTKPAINITNESHNDLKRELQKIQRKQEQLEAYFGSSPSPSAAAAAGPSTSSASNNRRWHIKMND